MKWEEVLKVMRLGHEVVLSSKTSRPSLELTQHRIQWFTEWFLIRHGSKYIGGRGGTVVKVLFYKSEGR